MSTNDRRRPTSVPSSVPPEVSPVETSWDDDTVPRLNLHDPLNEFDRVTAIPELPSELYAKRVMASVEDSRLPELPSEPPAPSAEPQESATFGLDTTPPPGENSPDSTAPREALSAQAAPTARPAAARQKPDAPTAPPTPGAP